VRWIISRACAIGLNFLMIAGIAYFAAQSINDVVAMRLASPLSSTAQIAAARPSVPQHPVRASYDPIVERDVFNSVKQSAPVEAEPVTLDLHLKLVGTSHLSLAEPFAIIEDQRNGQQNLYKLGSDVADAGKLVKIEKERVLINHEEQIVALEISKTPSASSASGNETLSNVEAYRKEQENIIREHRAHPARQRIETADRAARRSQKEAEREARRSARAARRAGRNGPNPAAAPPPGAPPPNQDVETD